MAMKVKMPRKSAPGSNRRGPGGRAIMAGKSIKRAAKKRSW